jgi:hypothetical protein
VVVFQNLGFAVSVTVTIWIEVGVAQVLIAMFLLLMEARHDLVDLAGSLLQD